MFVNVAEQERKLNVVGEEEDLAQAFAKVDVPTKGVLHKVGVHHFLPRLLVHFPKRYQSVVTHLRPLKHSVRATQFSKILQDCIIAGIGK